MFSCFLFVFVFLFFSFFLFLFLFFLFFVVVIVVIHVVIAYRPLVQADAQFSMPVFRRFHGLREMKRSAK